MDGKTSGRTVVAEFSTLCCGATRVANRCGVEYLAPNISASWIKAAVSLCVKGDSDAGEGFHKALMRSSAATQAASIDDAVGTKSCVGIHAIVSAMRFALVSNIHMVKQR